MMTKNNTGKFFALKLCGLLPAIALPVALFGLSTAEIASPVNPEPSITITDTTNIGSSLKGHIVSITIEDVDSAEKEIRATMKSGEVIVFNANDKQKINSISVEDISSISIGKDTAKKEISVTMKSGEVIVFNANDKQKINSISIEDIDSISVGKDTAKTKKLVRFTTPVKNKEEKVHLLGSVDVDPEFPGGQNAMMKFIYANLKYPKEAVDKKIQGRVTVDFIIKSDGNVDHVKVQKGVDPVLDAEAERVVKAMPAWTPGKYKGSTVAVRFFLPIVFQMKKNKAAETE